MSGRLWQFLGRCKRVAERWSASEKLSPCYLAFIVPESVIHSTRKCLHATGEKKTSIVLSNTVILILCTDLPACCVHWCNSGIAAMGVTNCFLMEDEACYTGQSLCLQLKTWSKALTKEIIVPGGNLLLFFFCQMVILSTYIIDISVYIHV